MTKKWKCLVCGYIYSGDKPPAECPQCSGTSGEFIELKDKEKLRYDKKKFDVLVINGSSHASHNTRILADWTEEALKKRKVSYRVYNLNELEIQHCWCCYSMKDKACTYPCRNQLDDAPALHEMVIDCKAIIILSPINWNNMSARLKDFLDRLNCIQNQCLLGKESLTSGKILGILINGHEDGAMKTAMDIFVYFQQMGYVLAPFGFTYSTHGAGNDTETDNKFFMQDIELKKEIDGVVNNVAEMMKLDLEDKLKGKIKCVCE